MNMKIYPYMYIYVDINNYQRYLDENSTNILARRSISYHWVEEW